LRVFADETVTTGPGVTGMPDVNLEIDTWLTGQSDPGTFTPWTSGSVLMRYLRSEIVVTTNAAPAFISSFSPTADKDPSTESADSIAVAPGGTHVSFSPAFHAKPALQVSTAGAGLIADYANLDASGFDFHVYNTSGSDVGSADASYSAKGK
jgi:hypothetical protein